jgi:hypothetical protein
LKTNGRSLFLSPVNFAVISLTAPELAWSSPDWVPSLMGPVRLADLRVMPLVGLEEGDRLRAPADGDLAEDLSAVLFGIDGVVNVEDLKAPDRELVLVGGVGGGRGGGQAQGRDCGRAESAGSLGRKAHGHGSSTQG